MNNFLGMSMRMNVVFSHLQHAIIIVVVVVVVGTKTFAHRFLRQRNLARQIQLSKHCVINLFR